MYYTEFNKLIQTEKGGVVRGGAGSQCLFVVVITEKNDAENPHIIILFLKRPQDWFSFQKQFLNGSDVDIFFSKMDQNVRNHIYNPKLVTVPPFLLKSQIHI